MLKVHAIPLGMLGTNCYIVNQEGNDHCFIIDPGAISQEVPQYLRTQGLTADAILLTHGHFDHVGGVRQLAADLDCPVYLCTEDLSLPPQMTSGPLYYTDSYGEGSRLTVAGIPIQVILTPGHTPGSVCLLAEDCLFSGDTLFAGSCGRTDFPGGDTAAMYRSLERLASLQGDYRVFPGHGESTTLAEEKRYNPYLK